MRHKTGSASINACARMPVARAVALALDLLHALEALHDAGLVHRDVKPHNVIFVGGVPKLADIGLAAIVQIQMSLAGTAGYVPLDGSTGPDADLYALGKLLYQTVTGLEPADFPGVPASLLTASEKGSLRRLNRFLLRACAPAKKDRFRSAQEMRPALEAVLRPRRRRRRIVVGMAVAVLLDAMSWWLSGGNKGLEQSKARSVQVAEAHVGPIFFRPGDDASAAQNECARQRVQPLIRVNSVGMKLILIPPGEFAMVGRRLPRGGRPCRGAVGCPAWSLFPVRQVDTTAVRFRPSPFAAPLGRQIGPAGRQLERRNVNFTRIMVCGIIPDLPAIAACEVLINWMCSGCVTGTE